MANSHSQPGCLQPAILSVLSLGQKRNCGHSAAEKFPALFHVLFQATTRRRAAGFGGKTAIIDDLTGIGWNDAAAIERERV